MNKKKYITPSIIVEKIDNTQIMADSINASYGDATDVQYSKRNNLSSPLDEEEDMEENWLL